MTAPDRPARDLLGALQTSLEAARHPRVEATVPDRPTREQAAHPGSRMVGESYKDHSARAFGMLRAAEVDLAEARAEVRALRAELERHAAEAHRYAGLASRLNDDLDEARAALAASTPQPAEPVIYRCDQSNHPSVPCSRCEVVTPAPLPAVPDGPREHVAAEAPGVLWMAMRYALGRATYAVQEVGSAIAQHTHRLAPWQRERMAQEIERELGYDSDGAAWGADAATWRQAIGDLRAPVPAVPDGEARDRLLRHYLGKAAARLDLPDQARRVTPTADVDEIESVGEAVLAELGRLRGGPSQPDARDVVPRLYAAAAALSDAEPMSCAGGDLFGIAVTLGYMPVEVRAAVAAALAARPTERER